MEATDNQNKGERAKITFKGYYSGLKDRKTVAPKTEFIRHIAKICRVSEITVRMWLYGRQTPDSLKQSIIAEDMGMPVEELFPPKFPEDESDRISHRP